MLSLDNWLSWGEAEWYVWLQQQTDTRRKVFTADIDEMIASYNRERNSARDYHGRELLELLQNADDAGAENEKKNRVLIELTDKALYVANTGLPFSPAGVKSLMVSDNSPKQLSRTRYIGYKGLGFRSILGWASEIAILSGDLSIGFIEKEAIKAGTSIYEMDEKATASVQNFLAKTGYLPIPTLAFPIPLEDSSALSHEFKTILERSVDYKKDGYDTVISFLLKDPNKTETAVESQIQSFGKEILLFSNYIEKAEFRSPTKKVIWDAAREGNKITVGSGTEAPSLWQVFERHGDVPPEYIGPGQPKEMVYEVKIAIPENNITPDRLFVYFPTEVLFPFPIVAHATFELGSNRQNLIESSLNRFVCEQLAETMAEAAEKTVNPDLPWKAFSNVAPRGQIDPTLLKLGFIEFLTKKCALKKLIPIRNKCFAEATYAKTIKGNFDNLLTGEEFSELCLWSEDKNIQLQLINLHVHSINEQELKDRINKTSYLLTDQSRAKLICSLIENNLLREEPAPTLLLDDSGTPIQSNVSAFLQPEGSSFAIPNWVPIRFVNLSLAKMLQAEFRISRMRDLAGKLKIFNVQEYNLSSIVSAIIAEANRAAQENPANELQIRQRMLNAIWSVYSVGSSEESQLLTQRITFIVPNRTGHFKPTNQLYFGKEYQCGPLMEALLGSIDAESFIAKPEALGFGEQQEKIESFLTWLGVASLPREEKLPSQPNANYLDSVLLSIKYPAKFEELYIEAPDAVRLNSPFLERITSFDRLEQILQKADSNDIIAWLAKDHRIESLRQEGDKDAGLSILPPYKQNRRYLQSQAKLPYPLWLLRNFEWLPTPTGPKAPAKCTIARGLPSELANIIGIPILNYESPIFSILNIDRIAIKSALSRIGVVSELDELPMEIFYEILFELPHLDPAGEIARSLYRVFVTRDEQGPAMKCEMQKKFFTEGKMFGNLGSNYEYFQLNKLSYLDNLTLPEHIGRFFPLLALDKRRGAAKVKRLFNVEALTSERIQNLVRLTTFEEHPGDLAMQNEIEILKPYVYALRIQEDSDRSELPPLRKLVIKLCRNVQASIEINGKVELITLMQGDSVSDGNTIYLVAEPTQYDRPYLADIMIADAIGEIISGVLKVNLNSDIARLASCPSEHRSILLDRMAGGSGTERLTKASELLHSPIQEDSMPGGVTPLVYPQEPSPGIGQPPGEKVETPFDILLPNEVGPVTVTQKDLSESTAGRKVKHTFVVGPNPSPAKRRRLVNPDRAENLSMEFEKEQGRFPILVSNLKGTQAYGCDILTFQTDEIRSYFQSNPDISKILRFIEVKGRVTEKGSICLKGNELSSAQKYRSRYYLYRIYEDENNRGEFELVELGDPLGVEKEALSIMYDVNPFYAHNRACWDVRQKLCADDQEL